MSKQKIESISPGQEITKPKQIKKSKWFSITMILIGILLLIAIVFFWMNKHFQWVEYFPL